MIHTRREGSGGGSRDGCSAPTFNGKVRRHVEPTCGWLSTLIERLIRPASSRQMASPRPLPPKAQLFEVDLACVDLGQVQKVVDDLQQHLRRCVDGLCEARLC